jgi:hypothetical protein
VYWKETKMSMIGSRDLRARTKPAIRARAKRLHDRADEFSLAAVLHDAIDDIEAGVEFWKTLGGNRRAKLGHSPEFLNRVG